MSNIWKNRLIRYRIQLLCYIFCVDLMHHLSYYVFGFLILLLFIVLLLCRSFLFLTAVFFLEVIEFLRNLLDFFWSKAWLIWFFLLLCISFFWLLLKLFGKNVNSLIPYKVSILKSGLLLLFFLSFRFYGYEGRQFYLILKVHYWQIYYYIYWIRKKLRLLKWQKRWYR